MNVYTLAARETVREIRESLSRQEPTLDALKTDLYVCLRRMLLHLQDTNQLTEDYESIELWASLAADIAGLIQQREKDKAHGL